MPPQWVAERGTAASVGVRAMMLDDVVDQTGIHFYIYWMQSKDGVIEEEVGEGEKKAHA